MFVHAHVGMHKDEIRGWSLLCVWSGPQVLILNSSKAAFHLRSLNWLSDTGTGSSGFQ